MRLSKFLSLSVAMSRNQAKFFIRKGRLSVDGNVVTDPYLEVTDANRVVFDGKPVSVANHEYIVIHKPAAYACTTKDTEYTSVLSLLNDASDERYYYFANVLGPDQTGLVLLSDDARWTNRMQRRLRNKARVYRVKSSGAVSEDQLQRIQAIWVNTAAERHRPVVDVKKQDDTTLLLTIAQISTQDLERSLLSVDLTVDSWHLQQLGRLGLGDLAEGACLYHSEEDIRI